MTCHCIVFGMLGMSLYITHYSDSSLVSEDESSQLSGSNYSCIGFQGASNDVLSSCVRCIYFVSLSFENYIPTVTYWVVDWLLRNPVVATIIFIGVSL